MEFEIEKAKASRQLSRLLKTSEKRLLQAQQRVEDCLGWPQIQHEGLLLQANYHLLTTGQQEITLPDWENDNRLRKISLNPLLDPQQQIAKVFARSRKLRRGVPHQKEQAEKALEERDRLIRLREILEKIQTEEELQEWSAKAKLPNLTSKNADQQLIVKKPYREFVSESGLSIWVGKAAKDNENLTFHLAKGSDWWLHARDVSGSHVVVRVAKGAEPDAETLQDAAQLALHYSKSKGGEGEVTVTQCKFLNRIKNRPGAVSVSKHRTLFVRADPDRLARVKNRKKIQ